MKHPCVAPERSLLIRDSISPATLLETVLRGRLAMVAALLWVGLTLEGRAGDGDLDPSFGTGGKVITDFTAQEDFAESMVIGSDGKILVAGNVGFLPAAIGPGNPNFGLARYTTSGALDASFGTGGTVTTDFSADPAEDGDFCQAVALDAAGKIIVAGATNHPGSTGGDSDFALLRYNSSGTLDSTFGTGGKVTTDFSGAGDFARCVAVDGNGRILVAGVTSASNNSNVSNFAIARYTSAGVLDPSFGTGGKVITDFFSYADEVRSIAIDSNGKILAAGYAATAANSSVSEFAIARYTTAGVLDTTFGTGGKSTTGFAGGDADAESMVLTSAGEIILAGTTRLNPGNQVDFALVRYTASGALDTSFGTGGRVITDIAGGSDFLSAMALDVHGKIVVAGNASISGQGDYGIVRYTAAGALDPTFGSGGKVTTNFNTSDSASCLAIEAGGNIVVAGRSTANFSCFSVARYLSDGLPGISLKVGSTPIGSGGAYPFETTNLGQESSATVTIANPGVGPLTSISAAVAPAGSIDFRVGNPPPPATIAAGDSATFSVIFSPQAAGNRTATLNVTSNASPSPYIIQLSGGGADTTPPVITGPAVALTVLCDDPDKTAIVNAWLAAHGSATATDNSGVAVTWTNNFTALPGVCGSSSIIFTAADASGNTATTSAQLTVQDIHPPVIAPPASPITVESDGQGNVAARTAWLNNHGGASAIDACSTVTWSHNFTGLANTLPQTVPVIFTANDTCGNGSTTGASFIIQDTTPPALTVAAKDYYGDCDNAAAGIAAFLNSRGSAVAVDIAGPVTWTNNYSGTLPDCGKYITVTFTATDTVGLNVSTSARFFLFPPGAIWIGPAIGSWSTAPNWHSQVPTAVLDAYVDLFDFQNTSVTINSGGTVKNLHIGAGDELILASGSLTVAGDVIDNAGILRSQKTGVTGNTNLYINGETVLQGPGKLILTGPGHNYIIQGTVAPGVLSVGAGQEITTTADTLANYQLTAIYAGLVNYGTITADGGGLTFTSALKTNHSVVRAISGGTIDIESDINNVDGTLFAGSGSTLHLKSTLTGGVVTGTGKLLMDSNARITGPITLDSGLTTAHDAGNTYLAGTIVNNGLMTVGQSSAVSNAITYINGAVTLNGSGKVLLQNNGNHQFVRANNAVTDVLTIGAQQEFTTDANTTANYQTSAIHAGVINYGIITADGGGLTLFDGLKTNHSIFRAINGGTLDMQSDINNADGTLIAGPGSTLHLQFTLTGGLVTGTGKLLIDSNARIAGPITLDSGLTTAHDAGSTYLAGTIINNGLMTVGRSSAVSNAITYIDGAVTLNGSGKVLLQNNGNHQFVPANNAVTDVLTIGAQQEFTTDANTTSNYQTSALNVAVINYGTITANGGGLTIYNQPKTNYGTFRVLNGGRMDFTSVTVTNYNATTDTLTGGRWEVVSAGTTTTLDLQSSPIVTIAANTFVCLSGANATFPQLSGLTTIAGTFCLENGKTFTTTGNLSVSGTLQFGLGNGGTQGFDSQRLVINGNVNFTGSHIDVRSLGTTPGLYEIARWTGTATGAPALGNIPLGLKYGLVFDTVGKTLKVNVEGVPGGELKILGIHRDPVSGTTTIDYLSQPNVSHTVRGTRDFLIYDNLPATAVGTGALMQYLHTSATAPDRYFYSFSTGP